MASGSERRVLKIPNNFYVGHLIGGKGKNIRDIQKLTGAKVNIPRGKIQTTFGAIETILLINLLFFKVFLLTTPK